MASVLAGAAGLGAGGVVLAGAGAGLVSGFGAGTAGLAAGAGLTAGGVVLAAGAGAGVFGGSGFFSCAEAWVTQRAVRRQNVSFFMSGWGWGG